MDAIFVGRRAELADLDALVHRAASPAPAVALIEAPAGAGKSALLDQLAARTKDALLIRVSGDEAESAIAFGVSDQLQAHLALPADGSRPIDQRRTSADVGGDLQVTGDALRDRLHRSATAHHRVVLVVDDAHLADRPSLAALGYALRRLPDVPIVTVLAARPEAAFGLPRGLLTMIDTGGLRLDLSPLSVDDVRELAGHYGHHDVNERAARRLREHTGGSPLHLRALLSEGVLPGGGWLSAPLPAPLPFARLIATQLGRLSPAARDLARAAAVLGLRADLCAAAEMARVRIRSQRSTSSVRCGSPVCSERREDSTWCSTTASSEPRCSRTCGEADLAADPSRRRGGDPRSRGAEPPGEGDRRLRPRLWPSDSRRRPATTSPVAAGEPRRRAVGGVPAASRPPGARRAPGGRRVRAPGGRRPRRRRGLPRPGGRPFRPPPAGCRCRR